MIYNLAVCSVLVALAAALSLVKVWQMPLGGSVTLLSMLPVIMVTIIYRTKWGFVSAFVYSLIQLFFGITMSGILGWGLTPAALAGTIILDYVLPFTLLGLAGVFKSKGYLGICIGTGLAVSLRFLCHFASGIIIFGSFCPWDNLWLYSLAYNGSFMLPELIFTVVGAAVVFRLPQIKKLMQI